MRRLLIFAALLLMSTAVLAQGTRTDTLYVSDLYTTHIVFETDATYTHLSNTQFFAVKKIQENANMVAVKARQPCDVPASVTVLESNGTLHTFILHYCQEPGSLVFDTRGRGNDGPVNINGPAPLSVQPAGGSGKAGRGVTTMRSQDAPTLQSIYSMKRGVYHIGDSGYDVTVMCENIFAYSDITFIVLSLQNKSGISYATSNVSFEILNRRSGGRHVGNDAVFLPQSHYGNLSAASSETSRIAYSFDKITLMKNQFLKITVYEEGGTRDFELLVSANDVNRARRPE